MSDNVFKVGEMEFEALSDRIIILEDAFRSGYECSECGGEGRIQCDSCAGVGKNRFGSPCSDCDSMHVVITGKDGKKTQAAFNPRQDTSDLGNERIGSGKQICPTCRGKGGLIVAPEVSERRPTTGRVVSIGPKVTTLKVGESVLYSNFAGFLVELNRATDGRSTALRILHEGEVMTKLKGHLKLTDLKARQDIPAFAT